MRRLPNPQATHNQKNPEDTITVSALRQLVADDDIEVRGFGDRLWLHDMRPLQDMTYDQRADLLVKLVADGHMRLCRDRTGLYVAPAGTGE